jgi:hypothetical protein
MTRLIQALVAKFQDYRPIEESNIKDKKSQKPKDP